ncbi:hypothetical protein VOLCADRAFT_94072 [Volvox carteri f. nagariensis]|uniref:Uncharacterized protein n=1 Tax=Volvox carteri f. nagariensis TaxID=3068 RepID=D8U3U6_VOLCA|nr:uncharacterized protein VOLCADRAFT_94072 [Volvox carteri f. nagariensis]EFJ45590.1 hypothetical protein VOLCADRAFT_94072 [Volvox carteri f. nagariensis]|eukprot:XP_002953280.1 hypothetical protein VOLCADRAFT_94072 [Volvox carteri f. nagariensis]
MDQDVAKRAAAAEARRQKILARGSERLNRITVGTPLPSAETLNPTPTSERAASEATSLGLAGASAAVKPSQLRPNDRDSEVSDPVTDTTTTAAVEATVSEAPLKSAHADALLASADPMLQQLLRGSGGQSHPDEDAFQASAQREAEQALHMLLNQLAGPAGVPYLAAQRSPPQSVQVDGSATTAVGSSGRTVTGLRGGVGVGGDDGPFAPSPSVAAAAAAARAPPHASGSGRRTATTASAAGSSGGGGMLLSVAAVAATVTGVLLGPQLTAAVAATHRLRCLAAVALAAALYSGLVEPAHLGLPPIVSLLVLQLALIAATRWLLPRSGGGRGGASPSATAAWRSAAGGLSQTASGAELAGDDGDATAASPPAAAAAVLPVPRADWAALVPGLRPLLDKVSSAGVLVSGLAGDVAVFVVSYMVLDAWGRVVS